MYVIVLTITMKVHWECMTVDESTWELMRVYERAWQLMKVHESWWECMREHDSWWKCITVNEGVWHESWWEHRKVDDSTRELMRADESWWEHIEETIDSSSNKPFSAAFVKYSAAFVRSTFPASPVVYIFPLKSSKKQQLSTLNITQ